MSLRTKKKKRRLLWFTYHCLISHHLLNFPENHDKQQHPGPLKHSIYSYQYLWQPETCFNNIDLEKKHFTSHLTRQIVRRQVSQEGIFPLGTTRMGLIQRKRHELYLTTSFFVWFMEVLQYFFTVFQVSWFVLRFFKKLKYENGNEIHHLLPRVLNL